MERLKNATVAVFGIGGVGGACVDALARTGVGRLIIVDSDTVNPTNINRQVIALNSTLGQYKTDVMLKRIKDINPQCDVVTYKQFVLANNIINIDLSTCEYVVDAVDTVSAKLAIIMYARDLSIPIISCMGTGNRLRAAFVKGDIYETRYCPLARVMRRELKKRGIARLDTVYSLEAPAKTQNEIGSLAFVPPSAGLLLAQEVVLALVGDYLG